MSVISSLKLEKKLIKLSIKSFSKIIFMNEALKHDTNVALKFSDKTLVQTAGYDEDFFYTSNKKNFQTSYLLWLFGKIGCQQKSRFYTQFIR